MKTRRYVLLSEKTWHDDLFKNLSKRSDEEWFRISSKKEFSSTKLRKISPKQIFIPHWSYIIPAEIFRNFECIVFHMTDLPYGRGGSPLQNLIVRGHRQTMISAFRVDEGIDTGPIYLKMPLTLNGTAEEIFKRASSVIEEMIPVIIDKNLMPTEQNGDPVLFKRRKATDGCMNKLSRLDEIYDYIRMLDAEGYPAAYIETDFLKIDFSNAQRIHDTEVIANVRITKK